eukprot:1500725-Amphidinium_carterae.1
MIRQRGSASAVASHSSQGICRWAACDQPSRDNVQRWICGGLRYEHHRHSGANKAIAAHTVTGKEKSRTEKTIPTTNTIQNERKHKVPKASAYTKILESEQNGVYYYNMDCSFSRRSGVAVMTICRIRSFLIENG